MAPKGYLCPNPWALQMLAYFEKEILQMQFSYGSWDGKIMLDNPGGPWLPSQGSS